MFLGSLGILNFAYTDPIQRDVGVLQRNTIRGVDHLPCLRWWDLQSCALVVAGWKIKL